MFKNENPNIGLQDTLAEHIGLIYELEKQGENIRFITPYELERHLAVVENEDEAHLTVWSKETGEVAGFIILAGLKNPNLSLEFRRIVIREKGKGIGRQCLKMIKSFCFNELKFHRLWLDVFEDNLRAIHLYKSEGFKEEGCLREVIKQGEKYRSLFILSMLEKEYFDGKSDKKV